MRSPCGSSAWPERGSAKHALYGFLDEVDHLIDPETLEEGQAMELNWMRDNDLTLGPDDYLRLVLKKTAWYSFIHPMRIGALVANGQDPNLCRFDAFGFLVGLAFQITDDVLNLERKVWSATARKSMAICGRANGRFS